MDHPRNWLWDSDWKKIQIASTKMEDPKNKKIT